MLDLKASQQQKAERAQLKMGNVQGLLRALAKALLSALVITLLFLPPSEAEAFVCPDHATQPFELTKQAAGIYVRKGRHEIFTPTNLAAIANVSIVIGKTSLAVIDTGGSYCDGKRFLAAIRRVTQKPISHIIITHTHPDHSFGTAAFENEKAIIIGHENLKRAMRQKGPLYLENLSRLVGKEAMAGTKIILPSQMVSDKMTIDLGSRKLELTAHPTAHTDHDLTVSDPETQTLWTGDLLFHEHTPVIDGSLLGWQKVIETMSKWPAKHVVPGHGGPYMPWPEALKEQTLYLAGLRDDLRRIIEEGGTMLEAQKQAGQTQRKGWLLFDEFNARNASTAFAELEWE